MLRASDQTAERLLRNIAGFACIAGAVVPGKYLRGTPVSINEINEIIQFLPNKSPQFSAAGQFEDGVIRAGIP